MLIVTFMSLMLVISNTLGQDAPVESQSASKIIGAGTKLPPVPQPIFVSPRMPEIEATTDRGDSLYDPTTNYEVFEDFLNGSSVTILEKINQMAAAGGGSGQVWMYSYGHEDAWGVIEAHHGTGQYSRLDLVGKTPNMHAVALGLGTAYEYQVRFNFASLSTPANRFVTFDGFFDGDTVDPEFNRGILFRYSDDINGGKFQIVVRETPDVETLIDTGVSPQINTWYRLKVAVNASGTEARFFINGNLIAIVTTSLAIGPNNRYTAESDNDRLTGNVNFVSRRFDYLRFRATNRKSSRL
jgi:hypothetical protein